MSAKKLFIEFKNVVTEDIANFEKDHKNDMADKEKEKIIAIKEVLTDLANFILANDNNEEAFTADKFASFLNRIRSLNPPSSMIIKTESKNWFTTNTESKTIELPLHHTLTATIQVLEEKLKALKNLAEKEQTKSAVAEVQDQVNALKNQFAQSQQESQRLLDASQQRAKAAEERAAKAENQLVVRNEAFSRALFTVDAKTAQKLAEALGIKLESSSPTQTPNSFFNTESSKPLPPEYNVAKSSNASENGKYQLKKTTSHALFAAIVDIRTYQLICATEEIIATADQLIFNLLDKKRDAGWQEIMSTIRETDIKTEGWKQLVDNIASYDKYSTTTPTTELKTVHTILRALYKNGDFLGKNLSYSEHFSEKAVPSFSK